MAVLIGHASIDENGKATGGTGGDQNGKEVLTRNWYSKDWNVLLRPLRPELAEKSARACAAACANPKVGYDQSGRNTLYAKAKAADFDIAAINEPCECDCSSLMHVCAIAGGANLTYGANGCTTRTMVRAFVNSGEYLKLTDKSYVTSSAKLQRGDILVKEGSHAVMVLRGTVDLPAETESPETADCCALTLPVLFFGSTGEPVRAMQQLLLAKGYDLPRWGDDGDFGAETARALSAMQSDGCIEPSGICEAASWGLLLGLGAA